MISSSTPGYIAPDRHYKHVPNYSNLPAPPQAEGQEDVVFEGRKTKAKAFVDCRPHHTHVTILIDR